MADDTTTTTLHKPITSLATLLNANLLRRLPKTDGEREVLLPLVASLCCYAELIDECGLLALEELDVNNIDILKDPALQRFTSTVFGWVIQVDSDTLIGHLQTLLFAPAQRGSALLAMFIIAEFALLLSQQAGRHCIQQRLLCWLGLEWQEACIHLINQAKAEKHAKEASRLHRFADELVQQLDALPETGSFEASLSSMNNHAIQQIVRDTDIDALATMLLQCRCSTVQRVMGELSERAKFDLLATIEKHRKASAN